MSVRNKNCVDFFPFEVKSLEADLGALAAVEEEEVAFAAKKYRC